MKPTLLILILPLLGGCADEQQDARGCVSARKLESSILRIDRAQGSAFLTKPTEMVTVKHVANAIGVSSAWRHIDISQKTQLPFGVWNTSTVFVRTKQVFAQNLSEELYVLELQKPLSWPVSVAKLREQPLKKGDLATGVGYTNGQMRSGIGSFVSSKFALQDSSVAASLLTRPTVASEFSGFRLTSAYEQYPLRKGSSGGGIFDCNGFLGATIARAYNEKTSSFSGANVFAVQTHSIAKEISR